VVDEILSSYLTQKPIEKYIFSNPEPIDLTKFVEETPTKSRKP
jgi:hypothetical protein